MQLLSWTWARRLVYWPSYMISIHLSTPASGVSSHRRQNQSDGSSAANALRLFASLVALEWALGRGPNPLGSGVMLSDGPLSPKDVGEHVGSWLRRARQGGH